MLQLRPHSFESSVEMLRRGLSNAMTLLEPDTAHYTLWKAYAALTDSGWIDDVLSPLYSKNVLVQICTHALVPKVCDWLSNPAEFQRMVTAAEDTRAEYERKYAKLYEKLGEACLLHETRCAKEPIAQPMIRMRKALQSMRESKDVQSGCRLLYSSSQLFRVAFKLQNERMIESLKTDLDIESSSDVPLSLMGL